MKTLSETLVVGECNPIHKLPEQYDQELKNLIHEVGNVARQQYQLSEQMLQLEASLVGIREKHRNFMVSSSELIEGTIPKEEEFNRLEQIRNNFITIEDEEIDYAKQFAMRYLIF